MKGVCVFLVDSSQELNLCSLSFVNQHYGKRKCDVILL